MFLRKCLVYLKDTVNHSVLYVLHHIFKSLRGLLGCLRSWEVALRLGVRAKGSETQMPAFTLNSSAFICFLHLHYILFEEGTQWPTKLFGNH